MTWENLHTRLLGRLREQLLRHLQGEISADGTLHLQDWHEERMRNTGELHDTLLPGLLGASMQLCLAAEWLPADSPAKPVLRPALYLMCKGIEDRLAALLRLRSRKLPDGSLEKALSDVGDDFARSQQARLRIVVLGETRSLEPAVQEQIFLIAREALLNALRHSQGSRVEVEVEYLPRKLRLAVRDNGIGIDPQVLRAGQKSHRGLTGMRQRAASIGAKIRVWSKRRGGTELEISLPTRGKPSRPNLPA